MLRGFRSSIRWSPRTASRSPLFTGQPGYRRTELLQDRDDFGRFVTIDHWASRDGFETFYRARRAELASLDAECERLTESERRLGEFRREVVEAP